MEVAIKKKAKRRHLSAQECEELGQSAAGTGVLTQPHATNKERGNSDPNRGLYPRTPTKRRRYAPASGSPSGRQTNINRFFSVSGVISSSPNKTSSPSTSACHNGRPSAVEEEEEEEEEDEDDDDVSLLAVPLPPEVGGKDDEEIDDNLFAAVPLPEFDTMDEDEIDDASLLGVPMGLESDARKEAEVDYLEGVTAEMFGDDSDFERCDVGSEGDEVEPLPDEHFGLLGSSRTLLQPQGSMDDLPEEVLRQILCLVPAQDLYRCVNLVCHRWRDVVQDTTFVPFKKQYYRYMMREKDTVVEILNVLKNSGIANPALAQDSIRNLVTLMAQHKVGERVRPEDVLERVKKHRLFPQAEASIRLRIPDIKKHHHLDCQGPNPYAAMAVILTLSESVGDVQALVSLLAGCMSLSAVTEYLSHMAMMLLALKRNNIQISNRLHYNIYYVLHLLENGPFTVSSGESSRGPQIHLTQEQQQILSHDIQSDHVVKIIAFAGTGKTTTLVKYAEQRPHLRFLYVAFNNSVVTAARRCFPSNVDCRTVHSLAYNDVGKRYKYANKLAFNVKPYSINYVLPKGRGGFVRSKVVASTLDAFMASADPTISTRHVSAPHDNAGDARNDINVEESELFVNDAETIWTKMKDLKEKSQEAYHMTHDGYLKLWQLKVPKPRLSDKYDAMFIDEAQDCNPAIMDVLLSQRCGKILVGDPHQQIYTFRGAVNALNVAPHTHIFYLTQSFRFGAEIAYVGATILSVCKRVDKILVGGKQKGGVCDAAADKAIEAVRTGVSPSPGTTAILSRCNLGVFSGAVCLIDANPNCRLHFIGDVKNVGLDKIMDLWYLLQQAGRTLHPGQHLKYIRDPLIRSFARKKIGSAFSNLKKYAEQTEDKELEGKLAIVEKYRGRIPDLVNRLNSCYESEIRCADFIVGTVHKAKGLEFHTVIVNDDFAKVPSSSHDLCHYRGFSFSKIPSDEWNLLYVAVTRAKTSLVITKNIKRILTVAGEYLLKSEMPAAPMTLGNTPPCSIGNCPNCITPGSAFTMSKPPMKYSDCESAGGPLCERCVWTRVGPVAFLMTDDVLSMAEIPQRFHRLLHDFIVAFI